MTVLAITDIGDFVSDYCRWSGPCTTWITARQPLTGPDCMIVSGTRRRYSMPSIDQANEALGEAKVTSGQIETGVNEAKCLIRDGTNNVLKAIERIDR